jgi:hypothetical protein
MELGRGHHRARPREDILTDAQIDEVMNPARDGRGQRPARAD